MPRHPLLRRVALGLMALAVAVFSSVAYYICTKGFFRPWRTLVSDEFEKRGMEVSLQRLTVDPFRGLVARDVKLYDAQDRRRVVAVIDELLLGVNYAHALRGTSFLDWVDLHNARITLPLDPTQPDGPKAEATSINARFFLPPGQIFLARAEAVIAGFRVYATGRLLNPESFPGPKASSVATSPHTRAFYELLSSLKFPSGEAPVLTVEFSGDLADLDQVAVDARLEAPSIRRKSYALSQLHARGSYRRGVLELQRLVTSDLRGELRAAGSYDFRTDKFSIRLNSSLGIKELAKAYGVAQPLEGFVLQSAPRLDLSVQGGLQGDAGIRIFGHVSMERFAFRNVVFRSFDADVSWTEDHWSVRELALGHASGLLQGDLVSRPDGFHAQLHGSINPHELAPALTGPLADLLKRFDFSDAPTLSVELEGPVASFEKCRVEGQVRFGRASFEGTSVQDLDSRLQCSGGTLTLAPFGAPPGENAEMTLVYDLIHRQARMEPRPIQAPASPIPPPASAFGSEAAANAPLPVSTTPPLDEPF